MGCMLTHSTSITAAGRKQRKGQVVAATVRTASAAGHAKASHVVALRIACR
jgi:hypothetical protein